MTLGDQEIASLPEGFSNDVLGRRDTEIHPYDGLHSHAEIATILLGRNLFCISAAFAAKIQETFC